MPQSDMTSIAREWFTALPLLVVWAVGLIIAARRRREHPQVSRLAMISCALSLFTLILMPVAQSIGYKIHLGFVPLLLSLIGPCLTALAIGLLLRATFLGRGQSNINAFQPPAQTAPSIPSRGVETALKILAGIARWSWRLCSIALSLFVAVFLLAGLSQGFRVSTDPEDLATILVCLVLFGAMILAWWREGLGGLIMLLTMLVAGVVVAIMYGHTHKSAWEAIAAAPHDLGPAVLPLLMLFSWSLRRVTDRATTPRKHRLAVVVALVLAVLIAVTVWGMFPLRLPNA